MGTIFDFEPKQVTLKKSKFQVYISHNGKSVLKTHKLPKKEPRQHIDQDLL